MRSWDINCKHSRDSKNGELIGIWRKTRKMSRRGKMWKKRKESKKELDTGEKRTGN